MDPGPVTAETEGKNYTAHLQFPTRGDDPTPDMYMSTEWKRYYARIEIYYRMSNVKGGSVCITRKTTSPDASSTVLI